MLRSRSAGATPRIGGFAQGQMDQVDSQPEEQPLESTSPENSWSKLTRPRREIVHANSRGWFFTSSFWASYSLRRTNLMTRRAVVLVLTFVVVAIVRLSLNRAATMNSLSEGSSQSEPLPAGSPTKSNQNYQDAYTSHSIHVCCRPVQTKTVDLPDDLSKVAYNPSSSRSYSSPDGVSESWRYPTLSRDMLEKLDLATPPYPDMDPQSSNLHANVDVSTENMDEYTLRSMDLTLPFAGHEETSKSKKLAHRVLQALEHKSKSMATRTRSRTSSRPSDITRTKLATSSTTLNNLTAVCTTATPGRFLMPLRIAEQESKSRLHFVQLLLLAKALNRTLVLPNVGKSRMGACGKWDWGVYYDQEGLSDGGWVTMEGFNEWITRKAQDSESRDGVTSQLVSVGTSIPPVAQHAYTPFGIDQSGMAKVSVFAYNSSSIALGTANWLEDPALHLPGCFTTRYPHLALESVSPTFVTIPQSARIDMIAKDIIQEAMNAFRQVTSMRLSSSPTGHFDNREKPLMLSDSVSNSEPRVLVVNWDLRYPIFPPSSLRSITSEIKYAPQLFKLAKKLAPSEPYLAVHWRMETVPVWDKMSDVAFGVGRGASLDLDERSVLDECAYALVDVIARTVGQDEREAHDQAYGKQVRTVWFASDYPYPIARTTKSMQRPPAVKAKSGTFRSFSIEHEKAVDVLRRAFEGGGDLEGRSVKDVAGQIEDTAFGIVDERREQLTEEERELLDDPGVLGIMDKLISMNAAIFVSGSPRCSKKSSFTNQVLDTRMNRWRQHEKGIWDVVETFG